LDEEYLVTGSCDHAARVWNTAEGDEISHVKHEVVP
jgi:WD40 repeat protein